MNTCIHPSLDCQSKASLKDGRFFICTRVWCQVCMVDFEFTKNIEHSVDNQQLLCEISPAALVMNHSRMEH